MAGRIALIGVLTGGQMNPVMIMRKSIRLQGIYVGSRAMFLRMNRAIEANGLEPVIDRAFPFEEARDAYQNVLDHLGDAPERFKDGREIGARARGKLETLPQER